MIEKSDRFVISEIASENPLIRLEEVDKDEGIQCIREVRVDVQFKHPAAESQVVFEQQWDSHPAGFDLRYQPGDLVEITKQTVRYALIPMNGSGRLVGSDWLNIVAEFLRKSVLA